MVGFCLSLWNRVALLALGSPLAECAKSLVKIGAISRIPRAREEGHRVVQSEAKHRSPTVAQPGLMLKSICFFLTWFDSPSFLPSRKQEMVW